MLSFILGLWALALGAVCYYIARALADAPQKYMTDRIMYTKVAAGLGVVIGLILLINSVITSVPTSHIAVVTTFGKVSNSTLTEGIHILAPWQKANSISIGMDVASALGTEAASKDLQSVHATLTMNYHVKADKVIELFMMNPSLKYETAFVVPSMYETFKAIVSQYTAEELITKRQEVSSAITEALNKRLSQYHIAVQTVNLVDFGFSKSFNAAIEEKVTANQKTQTAERVLERTKFEATTRITQAEGEAKAIAIQSAAIEKQGGTGYVQLQAIAKWDGKLPQYVTSGSAMPFVNVK